MSTNPYEVGEGVDGAPENEVFTDKQARVVSLVLYLLIALYVSTFLISVVEWATVAGNRAGTFRSGFALSAIVCLLWTVATIWPLVRLKRKQRISGLSVLFAFVGIAILIVV